MHIGVFTFNTEYTMRPPGGILPHINGDGWLPLTFDVATTRASIADVHAHA